MNREPRSREVEVESKRVLKREPPHDEEARAVGGAQAMLGVADEQIERLDEELAVDLEHAEAGAIEHRQDGTPRHDRIRYDAKPRRDLVEHE